MRLPRLLVVSSLLALQLACEQTVTSDADCKAWTDACNGCVQLCTPSWEVPEEICDVDCSDQDPLPACIHRDGECVFAD